MTGVAQFCRRTSASGALEEDPIIYDFVDLSWQKVCGAVLTVLATTTFTSLKNNKPELTSGFLWGAQHTDQDSGKVITSTFNTPNLKEMNYYNLLQAMCKAMSGPVGLQNAISCQDLSTQKKK